MHTIFCLVEHDAVFASEDFIGDFPYIIALLHLLFGHPSLKVMERRKTVHEYHVAVFGFVHHILRDLVRSQHPYTFRDLCLFAHRRPYVRIYHICSRKCVFIIGYLYLAPVFLRFTNGSCNEAFVYAINELLRTISHIMHAHFCTSVHPCIAHVVPHVSAEHDFALTKRLFYMLLHSHHIGQYLSRMIYVRKPVPYRHSRIFCQVFNDLLFISSVFNGVKHPSKDPGSVFERFFLSHLRSLRIQICDMCSLIKACYLE